MTKKSEVNRARITARRDKLNYSGLISTDQASITTTKVHLNGVISTQDARYLTAGI